jgi:extradiol dioxygenase family protein
MVIHVIVSIPETLGETVSFDRTTIKCPHYGMVLHFSRVTALKSQLCGGDISMRR